MTQLINSDNWRSISQHPRTPQIVATFFFLCALVAAIGLVPYFALRPDLSLLKTSGQTAPTASVDSMHLFGQYSESYLNLPTTQLAIMLQGTVITPDNGSSIAIIALKGQPAKTFKIGQSIMGAQIKKIFKTQVVLNYNGTLQSLPLPTQLLPQINIPPQEPS